MGANAVTTVYDFTAGQVLTAAQMDNVNCGIPVFATTTTRDAAFGGTGEKTLAEGQFAYIEATNTTQYYDGSAWQPLGNLGTAIFNEQQSSGTNGGTFNSGSYQKRTLNTTVVNTIDGCSLASSVITLPAGTYNVLGQGMGQQVGNHRVRLQNTTAGTTIALGFNAFNNDGAGYAQTVSYVNTVFTLSVTSTIELQHRCQTSKATTGFGFACSFGDNEVYAQIQIVRTA